MQDQPHLSPSMAYTALALGSRHFLGALAQLHLVLEDFPPKMLFVCLVLIRFYLPFKSSSSKDTSSPARAGPEWLPCGHAAQSRNDFARHVHARCLCSLQGHAPPAALPCYLYHEQKERPGLRPRCPNTGQKFSPCLQRASSLTCPTL